jgi:DNA mismatch repair protein MutS2
LHVLETQRADDAARAARERAGAIRVREEAEELVADLRERVVTLRSRAGQVVGEIAAEARRRVEAVVADLKRGQPVQEARQAVGQLSDLPTAAISAIAAAVPAEEADLPPQRIEPGQQVRVRHLGQVGTVLSDTSAQGLVEVQLPVGKTRVHVTALSVVGPAAPRREAPIFWTAGAGDGLSAEINVIGCTVEEAAQRVGRYLEDAVLGGLSRVRIIHGKGTGRLRRGISALLKEHPLVAGFQLASFEEGGAGATVVDLGTRDAAKPPPAGPTITE